MAHNAIHPSKLKFLLSRSRKLSGESLRQLDQDYQPKPGDILLEVLPHEIIAYQLSEHRSYQPDPDHPHTEPLPQNRYFTKASNANGDRELNSAIGASFSPRSGPLCVDRVYDQNRTGCGTYLHNTTTLSREELASGRYFLLETPEEKCTTDLVGRVLGVTSSINQ